MARAPVQELQITEALRPVAAPVDTFVQAAAPQRDTSLSDLAQGLAKFDGGLRSLLDEGAAKRKEEDALRAEAAFHANNRVGYEEGVRQGLIPANESRTFVETYKGAEGNVAGFELQQKFNAAYDAWGGKTSEDPKAFDAFLGGFIKDNVGSSDPAVLKTLLPHVRTITNNAFAKVIADRSAAAKAQSLQAHGAEAGMAVDQAQAQARAARKDVDYNAVFQGITAVRQKQIASGGTAEKIDPVIMDTVAVKAYEAFSKGGRGEADKVLGFFDTNVPGTNYKWGDTPYGASLKLKTQDALDVMANKKRVEEGRLQTEADKARSDAATRAAIGVLATDPNGDFPEALLQQGEKDDPTFRVKVNAWRDSFRKESVTPNPTALKELNWDIINGGGMAAVKRGVEKGILANKEDLVAAYKLAEGMEKGGAVADNILKGSSVKALEGAIRLRTTGDKDISNLLAAGGFSDTGFQAAFELKQQVLQWALQNPNATLIEQEKAVAEIGAIVLGRLGREGGGFGKETLAPATPGQPQAGPYRANTPTTTPPTPSAATPGGPPAATPAAPAPVAPAPSAPAPAAPTTPPTPERIQGWFNSLPEATQQNFKAKAAETGKPLSQIAADAYAVGVQVGRIKETPLADPQSAPSPAPGGVDPMGNATGLPISPIAFTTGDPQTDATINDTIAQVQQAFENWQEGDPIAADVTARIGSLFERAMGGTGSTSRNFAMAVLNDDPKAARILDFVSGAELNPKNAANYNAYFGNAESTKDLSKMTFDEVVKWSRNRGTKSSATGRYQFMRDTLLGLKEEMGIDGDTRFTPELQDAMAIQLLNRRGYQRWLNGEISTAKFANNLALEWASLPNLTAQNGRPAGVSAYAGDGLNKSLVSPASVLKALGNPSENTSRSPAGAPSGGSKYGPGDVYANIPERDDRGEDQLAKFRYWNPDPVGNHEKNLSSVKPDLAAVVRRAQADNPGLRIVVGAGLRSLEDQKKALQWGWSKTLDSEHLDGNAADIWVLDDKGRVTFDTALQVQMGAAMKKAAKDLGVGVRWGGDFKSFKDRPHFELVPTRKA